MQKDTALLSLSIFSPKAIALLLLKFLRKIPDTYAYILTGKSLNLSGEEIYVTYILIKPSIL